MQAVGNLPTPWVVAPGPRGPDGTQKRWEGGGERMMRQDCNAAQAGEHGEGR